MGVEPHQTQVPAAPIYPVATMTVGPLEILTREGRVVGGRVVAEHLAMLAVSAAEERVERTSSYTSLYLIYISMYM